MPLLLDVFLAGSTKVIEDIVGQEENCELLLPLILIISNIILNRLRLPDILFKVFSQKHQHIFRPFNLFSNVDEKDEIVFLEPFFIVCNTKSLLFVTFRVKLIERGIVFYVEM